MSNLPIVPLANWWSKSTKWILAHSIAEIKREIRSIEKLELLKLFPESYPATIPKFIVMNALLFLKRTGKQKIAYRYLDFFLELDSKDHFVPGQFRVYLDFRTEINSKTVNTDKCFQAKFGKHWGQYKQKWAAKKNQYDEVGTAQRLGISKSAAKKVVAERKVNTSGTLDNFIRRHGAGAGAKKYDEFCRKSAHTEDSFRAKFGSRWKRKWQTYLKSKDSVSLEVCVQRYGEEEGLRVHKQRLLDSAVTLGVFQRKHGKIVGKEKYRAYIIAKTKNHGRSSATKESLKLFLPIMAHLDTKNLDYVIGYDGQNEHFLFCCDTMKIKFYDFYVPDLNLIIEFDGGSHPSPMLSRTELKTWRCFHSGVSAKTKLAEDLHKQQLAEENGNTFLRIHSDVFKKEPQKYIKNYIRGINKLIKELL